jgi:hypothetical protein
MPGPPRIARLNGVWASGLLNGSSTTKEESTMKTKLVAASLCALALAACDFEQRPDSAPDQGGPGATRSAPSGSAPMSPATPPAGTGSPATPPAGGSSSSGAQ